MKLFAVVLCVLLGTAAAGPLQPSHASVLDLLKRLENFVEEEGHLLLEKVLDVIHKVESAILKVKESVPKLYEKVHEEADEILAQLKKVMADVEEILGKKDVAYGFDLLGGLTELTGGTKLGTVLQLLSLAEKAHKVIEDAKEFLPHLEKTLNNIQDKLFASMVDLAAHVVKELGLQDILYNVIVDKTKDLVEVEIRDLFVPHLQKAFGLLHDKRSALFEKIEDLVEVVQEKAHVLILDLFHNIEATFDVIKKELPELYKKVEHRVEEMRDQMHDILDDIKKTLHIDGYGLLDIAGGLTSGTSLGTIFKIISLIEKFNAVIQDIRNFGPNAEILLEHLVKKVADSARDFFVHTSDLLMKSP